MIEPYVHVIAGLAVCSRIADLWTTYLVTPKLKIEANFVARRFGWRFGLLTILVGFIPYVWPPFGIVILTASFMVSGSNASKILMAQALGEEELSRLQERIYLATPLWPGLLFLVLPGVFAAVLGCSMLLFYHDPSQWGTYFGLGMLSYSLAIFVWYPARFFRVRKEQNEGRD